MIRHLFTVLLMLFCTAHAFAQRAATPADVREEFTRRFQRWNTWSESQPERAMLTLGADYRDLVAMGPKAAPFFAETMLTAETPRIAQAMAEALARVTKRHFPREAWPEGKYLDPDARVALYARWWRDERGETAALFARLTARWAALKAAGGLLLRRDVTTVSFDDVEKAVKLQRSEERTELAEVYDAINDLGVDSLPLLVARFRAGDIDLLPIFRALTYFAPRGRTAAERADSCIAWWEANKDDWTMPTP